MQLIFSKSPLAGERAKMLWLVIHSSEFDFMQHPIFILPLARGCFFIIK
jgi:hypothetical protein